MVQQINLKMFTREMEASKEKPKKELRSKTPPSDKDQITTYEPGEAIVEIDTSDIYIPDYKVDRKFADNEAISALAEQIDVGQMQPCTVRPSSKLPQKRAN